MVLKGEAREDIPIVTMHTPNGHGIYICNFSTTKLLSYPSPATSNQPPYSFEFFTARAFSPTHPSSSALRFADLHVFGGCPIERAGHGSHGR